MRAWILAVLFILVSIASFAAPRVKTTPGEITDCSEIMESGSYIVTQDLPADSGLLVSGDCISLIEDFVIIDLNNHKITGPGTATGAAITNNGAALTNITVRGGIVTGFEYGVYLANSSDNVVNGVYAIDNSADGITLGVRGVASNNLATQNNRGLVLTCPANALGNSAWDNSTQDLFENDPSSCSVSEGHNSFGSSGGGGSCPIGTGGFADCSGTCSNLDNDEANCGTCGNACDAGFACNAGVCVLSCQSGLDNCSGVCTNLLTDVDNCGSCGNTCNVGESCSAGVCALSCQSGLDNCSGVCTNLGTDEDNCGGCGITCSVGEICSAGSCTVPVP